MRFMGLARAAASLLRPEQSGIFAAGPTMQFGLACVVDAHEAHELAFQCANAELAIVAPSTLQCSLPEKAAIYAVEAGKSTSLARGPATSQLGLKPGSAFSLNLPVKSRSGSVGCSILVNQYDRTGRRIARPAAILEGDRISGLFGLRRDADTYNLLIRLSGSGRVEFQQMSVENLPARPDLEPAIEGDGAVGELLTRHVQSLHRERKYDEAMAFADGLPEAWAHREVLRILTLYLQGDYESVIASFENGTRALQTNRAARHRYLRALANQGRVADLSRQIGRYVDTGESRPFLGAILPFAHGLDEDLCRRLTTYVMGDPLLPLNAVIACAEILLEIGETDAAHEAAKRARNIAKGRHERAEALLLRANIAVRQQANEEAAKQFAAAFESVGRNAITLRDPAKPLSPQNLRAKRI